MDTPRNKLFFMTDPEVREYLDRLATAKADAAVKALEIEVKEYVEQVASEKAAQAVKGLEIERVARRVAHEVFKEVDVDSIIKKTATAAVAEAFRMIDIDVSSRDEARDFRADMSMIRATRRALTGSLGQVIRIILIALIMAAAYGAYRHFLSGDLIPEVMMAPKPGVQFIEPRSSLPKLPPVRSA